jgi:signal transduction histidine kinase/ActR/RegA family two-component response regulator
LETTVARLSDKRLLIGLGFVAALLLASALLSDWNINRLDDDAARVAHSHEVLDLANDVLLTLVDAETGVRGYLLSKKEEYLQPYHAATKRLDGLIATLQEKTADNPQQQKEVNQFIEMANVYMGQLKKIIPMPTRTRENQLTLLAAADQAKAQMDAMRDSLARMRQAELDVLQEQQNRTRRTYGLARASTAVAAALGLLMVAAYYGLLRRNLSARKQTEEALRQADRRKDRFLATLAHELRNPLAAIRNAVELLRRADGNADLMEQAGGVMQRQVGQMVRLVDDLLDISRITNGKLHLRKEPVELATAVRSAVEECRPFLDTQSHELTVTLPPEPVYLDADPTRLGQVFANLLTNAAKYTEKGGHIWLTAERQGEEAVVSVRDTGIGIDALQLPHLFEMFSQAAPALERSQGGLGIGLALVRGLVGLHGGTIEARSDGHGLGSEFLVRLPLVPRPVATAPRPTENGEKPSAEQGRRILVVDDNRDAADSLALLLRLMGHDIHTAHDGLEAVQAAAAFRPEVVVLDIGLPKMDGYEAARHIRQQPWGKNMVLVALTGWGQEEDKRRAVKAGFSHHLTKPAEPADLAKLLAVLGRASPDPFSFSREPSARAPRARG